MNASDAMGTSDDVPDEDNIIAADDVMNAQDPQNLADQTELSVDEAAGIIDLVKRRASNRSSGRYDVIIVLDEWATDPKYGPIVENSNVLLAGRIEDYSEKAYYCQGTYEVLMDGVMDEDEQLFSKMVEQVDERDDGANEVGRKFLPKSAVNVVGVVD